MIPHLLFGSQIDVAVLVVNVAFGLLGSVETAYHTSNWSHTRSRPHKRYVVFGWVQYPYTKPKQSSVVQGISQSLRCLAMDPIFSGQDVLQCHICKTPGPLCTFVFASMSSICRGTYLRWKHWSQSGTIPLARTCDFRRYVNFEDKDMWASL